MAVRAGLDVLVQGSLPRVLHYQVQMRRRLDVVHILNDVLVLEFLQNTDFSIDPGFLVRIEQLQAVVRLYGHLVVGESMGGKFDKCVAPLPNLLVNYEVFHAPALRLR